MRVRGSHPSWAPQLLEVFFEGNFSEYEDDRRSRLGEEAIRSHWIRYREPTR